MKTLKLTLKKEPFEVMITGKKKMEFRSPSRWIQSRVSGRFYDEVEFTNGYGNDKPKFTAKYRGCMESAVDHTVRYSNGLSVDIKKGDFIILLGDIISTRNIGLIKWTC